MYDRDLDDRLRHLAARQHRCLTRAQARALGASGPQLQRRLVSPDWERVTPRVIRLAGGPPTPQSRCVAAALDVGGVVSHMTAAALYGLPGFGLGAIHVSRQKDGCRRPTTLAVVHRPRWLPDRHCTVVDDVPVTTLARTLIDLAAAVHPDRLDRAVENALNRRLLPLEALRATAVELAGRGRPGSTLMMEVIGKRLPGYVPLGSGLEKAFLEIVELAGVPTPERQRDVGGEAWVGRVDFAWPDRKLLVEVDSDVHHTGVLDRAADERRDAALRAAGYRVERVTEGSLRAQAPGLAARLLRWWADAAPRVERVSASPPARGR